MPAVPPPSSPVLDVRLSELEFSEETMEIQFLVQWNPPTTPNGQITHYLACLGGRNIPNFEEGPGDVKDGNDTTCQNIDKVRYPLANECLFRCLLGFVHRRRDPLPGRLGFLIQTASIFR